MEIRKIHLKGKDYSPRVVSWNTQQGSVLGGVTQDDIVFNLDGKLVKAKIVERIIDGVSVYAVHIVNAGKIITVNVGKQELAPKSDADLFRPALCLVDQTPVFGDQDLVLKSPLAGLVVKIKVAVGQFVAKNQPVVVIESMKMENEICAPFPAFIKTLSISEGNLVKPNQVIVSFERRGGGDDATAKRVDDKEVFECRGGCSGA